jgi:hypothetical protein
VKRGRSVEPVRLRRRMAGLRGPTVKRSNPRTRRSTRSCGKVFLPAIPAGRSPKSVRRNDGSPIEEDGVCKRALFVLDGKGVIFWSYCSPMAKRGSPRSRILRAISWPSPTTCSARLLRSARRRARGEGSLIEGVETTRRLLTLAFERFRVRPIEALGKRFDPTLHEAVAMKESAEAPGTVVGVVEDGYDQRPPAAARPASCKTPAECCVAVDRA